MPVAVRRVNDGRYDTAVQTDLHRVVVRHRFETEPDHNFWLLIIRNANLVRFCSIFEQWVAVRV